MNIFNQVNFTLLSPFIGYYTGYYTCFVIDKITKKTVIQPKRDEKKS